MKRKADPEETEHGLTSLREELEDGLATDPRVLIDPAFLGILHRELHGRLGGPAAAGVMLRAGFFHGLRDALLAMRGLEAPHACGAGPLLPMRLGRTESDAAGQAVAGSWPEPLEARARLAAGHAEPATGCPLSAGYTSGWLSGVWERDVLALEQSCTARGDGGCTFLAREAEAWGADPRVAFLLEALPFDALWSVAQEHVARRCAEGPQGAIDPESPAVHVWGPVMVVPYAGTETAVAVETVVREPGARQVSVVVLDLAGIILDEGFGALSLEHALDAIEASGAETVLTGISSLSERVVAELERDHVVVRKSLAEAVATAFQIADSQRNPA